MIIDHATLDLIIYSAKISIDLLKVCQHCFTTPSCAG